VIGHYLNIGQIVSYHIPKTHCSLIMLSFEAMYFEIKSVLNIKIFYVKIRIFTFIRKKSPMVTKKMQLIRRKYKIINI
jgi:hypothetical protein